MTDLDELEARARETKEAVDRIASASEERRFETSAVARGYVIELRESIDPDTVLLLIDRVRAGDELAACVGGFPDHLVPDGLLDDAVVEIRTTARALRRLRAAVERWESLAHPPQEET